MIDIRNVRKKLGGKMVLDGVFLHVARGETVVIMGRSGEGKSVLLKHIIGLIKPDEGSVFIDGVDITALRENELNDIRKRFGMLFQAAALFDYMTVFENVGFAYMEHTRLCAEDIRSLVREKLEMVDLREIEEVKPAELSGGMKKRVGLARAIAMNPEILLYDEPTTGLDPITGKTIDNLIVRLKKKLQTTGVAVTHDIKSAFRIADRIAFLNRGKIVGVFRPDEIQNAEEEIVKEFLSQ
ncbi:MAG: ABC transporter ATP-binding protein [Candidatus Aureabacteria bacterium]|nr:ABC transporter ATP-binding protein [Candidatus Auribacterota bacterium]